MDQVEVSPPRHRRRLATTATMDRVQVTPPRQRRPRAIDFIDLDDSPPPRDGRSLDEADRTDSRTPLHAGADSRTPRTGGRTPQTDGGTPQTDGGTNRQDGQTDGQDRAAGGNEEPLGTYDKMKKRFQYLEDGGFFKLKSAKVKEGKSDVALEFKCIICGSNQSLSSFSNFNLRRHIERKHSLSARQQFDKLWENHKRKTEETDAGAKKIKLQTNMHNFYAGSGQSTAQTVKPILTQARLDDATLNFVVATNQSNRVIEHSTFKHLVLLGMYLI